MTEVAAMRAVDADDIDADVRYVVAQALAHDFAAEPRALDGLRAGVRDLAFADESRAIAHAHLIGRRSRAPTGALHRDPIGGGLAQRDGAEIGDHIGCDVAARVGDLVEELLVRGAQRDGTAGADDLAEHAAAVAIHVAPRKAELREIRHVLEPGLGEVSAGDLARAFEQMPD